jgi:hypothetical protein
MARLPQHSHRLHPAQDLLDEFPLPMAELIPLVPRGAPISRIAPMALALGHVRRHPHRSQRRHKALRVEARVAPHRQPPAVPSFGGPHHLFGRLSLCRPHRLCQTGIDHQPVPVFHQHVSQAAQLGFFSHALATLTCPPKTGPACRS